MTSSQKNRRLAEIPHEQKHLLGSLLEEYEFDYQQTKSPDNRTEVLHPLFVWEAPKQITIGHLADTHCDTRADIFEVRLNETGLAGEVDYNNVNTSFSRLYAQAKSCDLLIMTGDLLDYSRGHHWSSAPLGDLAFYHLDRNWFLFYKLLASGQSYTKPVYTVLGNHDWRVNPYAPVTRFDSDTLPLAMNLTQEQVIRLHGPGATEPLYRDSGQHEYHYDQSKHALVTDLDSIRWYLLLINPFLDYAARLPGGYAFLMLDWAKEVDRWSSQDSGPPSNASACPSRRTP